MVQRAGGVLLVGTTSVIEAAEPAASRHHSEVEALANVFERLVQTDMRGTVCPMLCESWHSEDGGKSYQLTVRAEVRRHDDAQLTASDVKRAFERSARVASANLPAALSAVVGSREFLAGAPDIAGLTAVSERVLRVELTEPLQTFPSFLTDLRMAVAVPTAGGALVGTGPFRIARVAAGGMELERHDRYWRAPAAPLRRIVLEGGRTVDELRAGLEQGRYHLVQGLSNEDIMQLIDELGARAQFVEYTVPGVLFAMFRQGSPWAQRDTWRRAVFGSVSHELVQQRVVFEGAAEVLLPPGVLGHDPNRRRAVLGAERARQLLEGDPDLPDRLSVAASPSVQRRYPRLLSALFERWRAVGVAAELATTDAPSFERCLANPETVDVALWGYFSDYDDADSFIYGMFHSRGGLLRGFHATPALDDEIERARRAPGDQRAALYRAIDADLVERAFVLPLCYTDGMQLAAAEVVLDSPGRSRYIDFREIRLRAS
jgi:ABC-type transport system substrate-binding protein